MTKKTKAEPQRDLFAETVAMQTRVAATATRFHTRILEETAGFTFEMFDFFSQRIGKDIAATNELGQCKTIEDAFDKLGEFQKQALEDYTCESAKLTAQSTHTNDVLREEVADDAEAIAKEVRRSAA